MANQNHHPTNTRPVAQPNRRVHAAMVILMFLIGSDIFSIALGPGSAAGLIKFVLLFPVLGIVITNYRHLFRGFFLMPELMALIALAVLSTAWSVDPVNTLERAFPLTILTFAAIILGSMVSLRSLIITLGFLASLVVFASFAAIITLPAARGTPPWDDVWRGVFNHKNGLGASSVMALFLAVSSVAVTAGQLKKFFAVVAIGALVLLIASQSRTSQLMGGFAMIALLTGLLFHRRAVLWFAASMLVLVAVFAGAYLLYATGTSDQIIESFGRKTTLSGRIPLWTLVWPKVEAHFWLGYGYHAFWDPESSRVMELARDITLQFTPNYSHNGLIETWLNTGFIGVMLFVGGIIRVVTAALTGLRASENRTPIIVAFTIVLLFLLLNITESNILSRENLIWMVFVSFSVKLCAVAKAAKGVRALLIDSRRQAGTNQRARRQRKLS